MKKIYLFIPFILIFVLLFSSTVCAVDYAPLYCENKPIYDSTQLLIDDAKTSYRSVMGMSEDDPVYYICWMYNQGYDYGDGYCWTYIYICNEPIVFSGINDDSFTVRLNGAWAMNLGCYMHNVRYEPPTITSDMINYGYYDLMLSPGPAFLCSSHSITDSSGLVYLEGIEEEVIPPSGGDFLLDSILQGFEELANQSEELNNNAQSQVIVPNVNTPNDNAFLNVLQSIAGLNSIGNNLLNQFASYSLGLLSDIKDIVSGITGNLLPENLTIMIDQLYESGLDSSGNFGIDTMLNYWFIPDSDNVKRSFDNTIASVTFYYPIQNMMLDFFNNLKSLEPVAPVITVPAWDFSFSPHPDVNVNYTVPETQISFEWFKEWKPYTDVFIAAFVYLVFAYHFWGQVPSILNGGAITIASVNYTHDQQIKEMNRKAKGG